MKLCRCDAYSFTHEYGFGQCDMPDCDWYCRDCYDTFYGMDAKTRLATDDHPPEFLCPGCGSGSVVATRHIVEDVSYPMSILEEIDDQIDDDVFELALQLVQEHLTRKKAKHG